MIDKKKLLDKMTLEQKVAQLCGIGLNALLENGEISVSKCEELIPHGIGHICQFASGSTYLPTELALLTSKLQKHINSICGIPVLFHEEAITGVAARGATITPQMIGMSCTWEPSLVYENAKASAIQMKKLGGYLLDVITDARWGRGEEGFGEESRLVAEYGLAFIKGLQSEGVSATAKHFAGYGVDNQEMAFFRNETLFPFEVAIKKGEVKSVMPGYHAFHEVPCSASSKLLSDILRNDLGFTGAVVSDYGAVKNVCDHFHYTETHADAAIQSLLAGIDVDYPNGICFKTLVDSVRENKVDISVIDKAVERVLVLKENIMLNEYINEPVVLDNPENRERALNCARKSIVMLENNGVLPLNKDDNINIALVGPNANSYYSLLGDYTWGGIAEYFHRLPADKLNPKLITLKEGLENRVNKNIKINYSRGCDWSLGSEVHGTDGGDERAQGNKKYPLEKTAETNFNHAVELAKNSDVIIAAMGENRYLCGECCNRDNVNLAGEQESFVRALIATGKPVVLVIFGGRPLAISELAKQCSAVLYAWYPGEEGGNAVADIILGDFNPSAKLTVTLPDTNECVPVCYQNETYNNTSIYPFGYGLSYTEFKTDNIVYPSNVDTNDEFFDISYDIENIGKVDGSEIIQFYVKDENENTKRLIAFSKSDVTAKSKKSLITRFYLDQFSKYDAEGNLTLSPQTFELILGTSSADISYSKVINISGDTIKLNQKQNYFANTRERT